VFSWLKSMESSDIFLDQIVPNSKKRSKTVNISLSQRRCFGQVPAPLRLNNALLFRTFLCIERWQSFIEPDSPDSCLLHIRFPFRILIHIMHAKQILIVLNVNKDDQ
jgi:hypothetical protein